MKVGVIGLGYVGLPLAVAFAEAGRDVVGLDSDPRVVDRIRNGASAVEDVPAERLTAAGDGLRSTTDHDELGACEYHDPHVPELPELGMSSVDLDGELARADLACVITAHPELDYRRVVGDAALGLDFRGITREIEASNLVRL